MANYWSFFEWLSQLTDIRDEREKDPYCGKYFYSPANIQIFPSSSITKAQFYSGQPCIQLHFPASLVAWALVQDNLLKGRGCILLCLCLAAWNSALTVRALAAILDYEDQGHILGTADQRTGKSLGPWWLYEATTPILGCLLQELLYMRK